MSDRPKPPRPGSNPRMIPPPLPPASEPISPEVSEMLRDYLEEQGRERAEGNTIANVLLLLHSQQAQLNEHGAKIQVHEMRLDRHGQAIRALRTRVDTMADGGVPVRGVEHDTGVHQVEELKRHLATKEAEIQDHLTQRRDSMTWWKRKKIEILVGAAGAVAATGLSTIGILIWYIITHGK